ncbi:thiol reductant ABC exporter subunit CydC [Amycolatopsis sp. FDAARGOS 1241]|uniref:thiol reductant ABC exporter subunit CydC n=1 Tax=Amycolatopsis sp. FDAARGOS 1241 TaxID=2778070 RepID=UPI00194EDEAC|nr:thiol reductant ABC exporter subunit CydC [Amycolatopsis sp. FDAARGOS 1241]QRP45088.1 thiol reductant ABC exporter subunit CydC [Amycolatopsis sp. FDAARGOS 1241]
MNGTRLIRAALLAAGAELAGLALTGTAAWLLMRAAERPPLAALTVAIVAVRVFALARGGLRYAERLAGHEVVLRYLGALRARVYEALVPRRVAEHSGADLATRLVSDVDSVQDAVLRLALPAVVAGIVGVAVTVTVGLVSLAAAAVVVAGLAVAGVVLPWLAARVTAKSQALTSPARQELAERTVELVTGRRELVAYGAEAEATAAAGSVIDGITARVRGTSAWLAVLTAAGALVQLASMAAVALLAGASVPVTAALTLVVLALFEIVLPLTAAAQRVPELRASLGRVRELLATTPAEPPERTGPGHLRLTGVGVRHPGRVAALDGVDLDLPPDTRLGVLGPSGAGKTTLLHVLLGFTAPTSGRATLDGRPIEGPNPRVVSGALADAHVFATTVRGNLRLAAPDAGEEELLAACAVADLDVPLDRAAGTLSGGQRQRLVLARAVLAAPPVLVLDEPVEGLDEAHGAEVLARVLAAAKGSVVLVTHRPEHLAGFDRVLSLEDGRPAPRASAAGPAPGPR